MTKSNQVLAIVIPCYNEELIVEQTTGKISEVLEKLISDGKVSNDSYICFVDDGSTDKTSEILDKITEENKFVRVIRFLCNFGHQKAILCGMTENEADIYITLDCDLQDDITVIPEMIDKYINGDIDVVYGKRNNRTNDSALKRLTAEMFYKFLSLMGVKTLENSADFRLVSKNVVNVLRQYKETNIYLRGLIFNLGFKYDTVYYKRLLRIGGISKYPIRNMFKLASDGITSTTDFPVRLISICGIVLILLGIIQMSKTVFIGGINLFATGIIGEYITKTHFEAKRRPNWIIREKKNYD